MNMASKPAIALISIIALSSIAVAFGTWIYLDSQRLRVGYIKGDMNHAALYYARSQGSYLAADLDLKFVEYSTEQAIMEALNAGSLDLAYVGLAPAVIFNRNNGTAISVLAAASVNGTAIMVNRHSPINTLAGLENKTIAVPSLISTQEFLLRAMLNGTLAYSGISNNTDDVKVGWMSPDQMIIAMNGTESQVPTIDAYIAWEGLAARGIYLSNFGARGYQGKYLANSSTTWPNHPSSVVVCRTELLGQATYRDMIVRFLGVHASVTDAINAGKLENPTTSSFYLAIEREMSILQANTIMALSNTGFVYQPNIALVKTFVGNMTAFGEIGTIPDLDGYLASFYNTTLLDQALGI
jgi:NitT/TauT family transport system substrate-binding protein